MDLYSNEIERSLPETARHQPAIWIKESLKQLGAELRQCPGRYKLYGCWWWGLKHLLKTMAVGPRSAWYLGPCQDETVRTRIDLGDISLNLQAALERARLWDDGPEWLDRREATRSICEWPDGQVELYQLSDTDAGHQLDLFETITLQEQRLRHYLNSITDFLPRTWRNLGDQAMISQQPARAAVCYQRMLHLSTSQTERSDAWLLLGLCYDQMGHFPKAIFCYKNLFEKDKEDWLLGNIASSCYQAGRIREAIEYWEQALYVMPGNPEFAAGLATARHELDCHSLDFQSNSALQLELAPA